MKKIIQWGKKGKIGQKKVKIKHVLRTLKASQINRPFLNYLWPLFQSESRCSSFHKKISFHLHVNENQFSYETISTMTHLEKEAKGNSENSWSTAGLLPNKSLTNNILIGCKRICKQS